MGLLFGSIASQINQHPHLVHVRSLVTIDLIYKWNLCKTLILSRMLPAEVNFCLRCTFVIGPATLKTGPTMPSSQVKGKKARLIPINSDKPLARPDDWDNVRGLITRLYVEEDRTLKETMTIMSRDHGHNGT